MTDDRFNNDDSAYAAKRKAKQHERETAARAKATADIVAKRAADVDAGQYLPPPPPGPPGPPPAFQIDMKKRYPKGPPIPAGPSEEERKYIPADVLGGLTRLPNGTFNLADCVGIRISTSGKGLLVQSSNLSKPDWFPIMAIDDDSDVFAPETTGNLIVSEWLAKKRGWVG